MKYIFTIACALAMSAALTACRNNEGTKPAPSPSPQAAAAVTPAPSGTPAPSVTPGPKSKPDEDYDFRGTKWGMSKAEVKKSERRGPKAETDDSLTFKGKYKDNITDVIYKFKDDKLYRASVFYATKLDSPSLYIDNYENIKKDIIAAYGKPVLDGEKQTNPSAVIDPDKKAEAVCKNELMYAAQWNLPRSIVFLMVRGDGKNCITTLHYIDVNAIHSIAEQDGHGGIDITE